MELSLMDFCDLKEQLVLNAGLGIFIYINLN